MTEFDPNKTAMQVAAGLAKDIYVDGVQPPVKVLGETLAGILRAITHYPRFWGQISEISLEEKTERFRSNLLLKTEAIPQENRVVSLPHIIGPAIQALEYGIFEDHLSDMFASLIASSMDNRLSSTVHPSFVEIIKQITSDEAKVVRLLGDIGGGLQPICGVNRKVTDSGSYNDIIKKYHRLCAMASCDNLENFREVIENLDRLEIVEVSLGGLGVEISDKSFYEPLLLDLENKHNIVIGRQSQGGEVGSYYAELGVVYISAFGLQFYKACVKQHG